MTPPTFPGVGYPKGYVEAQTSWVGRKSLEEITTDANYLAIKTLAQNPGYVRWGGRLEEVTDGAGVMHYNLYLGFAPAYESSEPLNPRNMNDAPLAQPGLLKPEDIALPMGYKEAQFGKGT